LHWTSQFREAESSTLFSDFSASAEAKIGDVDAGPPKSADRNVIKRRSIESVSAAIFSNPGEAKKRPCNTEARCQAKPKNEAEGGSVAGAAAPEPNSKPKFPFPKSIGRRGNKKYRRRFSSQVGFFLIFLVSSNFFKRVRRGEIDLESVWL
jgi:hypothetical protein